jgi:hypothetical protein
MNGDTTIVGCSLIEFVRLRPGIVDTKISNITIRDGNEKNVTFQFETQTIDNSLDIIDNLMRQREIREYFANDIKNERELFKKLIAHSITRVNVSTGEREDFGVVVDNVFDDVYLRTSTAVKPLETSSYRYEIYPLLRSPETLLENLSEQRLDSLTKKPYKYSPFKFYHPLALTRGMLITPTGTKKLSSKSMMMYGLVGSVSYVNVDFLPNIPRIANIIIRRADRDTIRIDWTITGSVNMIDHFVVMKDFNGVRTIIGKVHSEFVNEQAYFIHRLGTDDVGRFKYIVKTVMHDYSIGQIIQSQEVQVS